MTSNRMAAGHGILKVSDLDRSNSDFVPLGARISGHEDFSETTGSNLKSWIGLPGFSRWTRKLFLLLGLCVFCAPPAEVFAQSAGFLGAQVTVAFSVNNPLSVAVDKAGTVFVADYGNNTVVAVPPGGGSATTLPISVAGVITALAVDDDDNLYIGNTNGNSSAGTVMKVSANGGLATYLGSGWVAPLGIAVDGAGDVFVADWGLNKVVKLPVGGGQVTLNFTGLFNLAGVAVDSASDVFASLAGAGVRKLPAGGGAQTNVGTISENNAGIAVDASGDLFVTVGESGLVEGLPGRRAGDAAAYWAELRERGPCDG